MQREGWMTARRCGTPLPRVRRCFAIGRKRTATDWAAIWRGTRDENFSPGLGIWRHHLPAKLKLMQTGEMVLQQKTAEVNMETLMPFLKQLGWEPES
jgi:hypothetical protein